MGVTQRPPHLDAASPAVGLCSIGDALQRRQLRSPWPGNFCVRLQSLHSSDTLSLSVLCRAHTGLRGFSRKIQFALLLVTLKLLSPSIEYSLPRKNGVCRVSLSLLSALWQDCPVPLQSGAWPFWRAFDPRFGLGLHRTLRSGCYSFQIFQKKI